jgi:heme A synthase
LLSETPAQGHLIVAFAVVAAAVWLVRLIHDRHAENRPLLTASRWLAGLVGLQILLGVQTWFVRFPIVFELPNHWFFNRDLFRSGHVLVGAFILATSAALTLEAWRRASWALNPAPLGRLEGAV